MDSPTNSAATCPRVPAANYRRRAECRSVLLGSSPCWWDGFIDSPSFRTRYDFTAAVILPSSEYFRREYSLALLSVRSRVALFPPPPSSFPSSPSCSSPTVAMACWGTAGTDDSFLGMALSRRVSFISPTIIAIEANLLVSTMRLATRP